MPSLKDSISGKQLFVIRYLSLNIVFVFVGEHICVQSPIPNTMFVQ